MDKLIEITYNLWVIIKLLGTSILFIILLFSVASVFHTLIIAPILDLFNDEE